MTQSPNAGLSPLDIAHGHAAAGKRDEAVRICVALLERHFSDAEKGNGASSTQPGQPFDVVLLTTELVGEKGSGLTTRIGTLLRDAFIAAGDLPQAVVAAQLAAGSSPSPDGPGAAAELKSVAKAFAKGSPRLADHSRTPPTLPLAEFAINAELKGLDGKKLGQRGAALLERFLKDAKPASTSASIPTLPLFSALTEASLARLLEQLHCKDIPTDGLLIRQGTEGKALYIVVRGMLEAFVGDAGNETRLAALGPGSVVGEMALVSDAPRAASVRAAEPTRILAVHKTALEQLAKKEPALGAELAGFCRQRMLHNLLRHSFALSSLADSEKQALLERFQTQSAERGSVLVREGEEGPGLFLIAAGHVRVTRTDSDGDALVVADLGPGEVVGEISLVLRRPATATVTSTHTTVTLFLPAKDFQAVVADHPGLLQKLYGLAVDREEELHTVVAQQALELGDVTLL